MFLPLAPANETHKLKTNFPICVEKNPMRRFSVTALCLSLALAPASFAQEGGNSDEMNASLAAGYKAAFVCSATFNAKQTMGEIEANELSGIYPDYREEFGRLPQARVDNTRKTVSVRYSRSAPPRVAAWREGMGCTQLPPGADISARSYLPSFTGWRGATGNDTASGIGSNVRVALNTEFYEILDAPVTFAFDGATYGAGTQTSAVIVLQDGQIVAERYDRGIDANTPQRTWSVAKSITATVIGAAVQDGILGLDNPAVVKNWSSGADPRRSITLRHLLQMASGLDSGISGSRTDRIYFGGGRVVDHALTRTLEADPGTRFKYANNDTLAAMRALREALGSDAKYHAFPYTEVLWKIGATRTTLEIDWGGDFISSSQVWTTARDLVRIGQLYLQNGRWGNEQIIHPDFIRFVSTPGAAQPTGSGFRYGAQFWLLGSEAGVPQDTFAAMGHRGQYLVIIPSTKTVIVRRGYDESGGGRFDIAAFTRDISRAISAAKEREAAAEQAARDAEQAAYEEELAAYEEKYGKARPERETPKTLTAGERLKRGAGGN